MTTTADELRTAAETLRKPLANPELTPGPWISLDHGDRLIYDGPGAEDQPPVYVVDEPMSNGANADYIEVMHPGIGAAIADWLEQAIRALDEGHVAIPAEALAAARQINATARTAT